MMAWVSTLSATRPAPTKREFNADNRVTNPVTYIGGTAGITIMGFCRRVGSHFARTCSEGFWLFLAEGPGERVQQRINQEFQHRPLASGDHNVRLHSGQDLLRDLRRDRAVIHHDPRRVIRLFRRLVLDRVSGYALDPPQDDRRTAGGEVREADLRLLADLHAFDVRRRDPRHDVESLADRNDLGERVPRLHHGADGVNLETENDARALRPNIDPPQHVLGDQQFLPPVPQLGVLVGHMLGGGLLDFLPGLADLDPDLLHALGEPRNIGLGDTELAFDAGTIALEREVLVARIETLGDQGSHRGRFGPEARQLRAERSPLAL